MDSPLKSVHKANAESGNKANGQGTDDTADRYAQATAVHCRKHLSGYDTSYDAPSNLLDEIQHTNQLRWPVTHEVASDNLSIQRVSHPFQKSRSAVKHSKAQPESRIIGVT